MDYQLLSEKIKTELDDIGNVFSDFQKKIGYQCPSGCGKCCINPDIACSPFELLPLALEVLKLGTAESLLEKAKSNRDGECIFLNISNRELGLATCDQYQFRPLICRAFGVAGRKNKNEEIELSICRKLKELYPQVRFYLDDHKVPFIGNAKRLLEAIDPVFLEPQININSAFVIILEKILLWDSYQRSTN